MPGMWWLLWKYLLPQEQVTQDVDLGKDQCFDCREPGPCRDLGLDWELSVPATGGIGQSGHRVKSKGWEWVLLAGLSMIKHYWRGIFSWFFLTHPDGRLFLNASLLFECLFSLLRFVDLVFCKPYSQDQRSRSTLCHEEISRFFFFLLTLHYLPQW